MACDISKTYTLKLSSSMASFNGYVFVCYYDKNQSYISCSDNFVGTYQGSAEKFTAELAFPSNANYIKLRLYATDISAINKSTITLTTT